MYRTVKLLPSEFELCEIAVREAMQFNMKEATRLRRAANKAGRKGDNRERELLWKDAAECDKKADRMSYLISSLHSNPGGYNVN